MLQPPLSISIRANYPDFLDLPWNIPLIEWEKHCYRITQVPRGLSRHPVVFLNYEGVIYALKELPLGLADKEYGLLREMEDLNLPAVTPVGHTDTKTIEGEASVLITRYLENSLPYRMLFKNSQLKEYQDHLLDAMAGLLVQLHLAGIFWGDCSLSNTLFRRNAGMLQAYLVDAETSEVHPSLSATMRQHDNDVVAENVTGELADMSAGGYLSPDFPIYETGDSIRLRYEGLWNEITRDEIISSQERYRITERVRALNNLGFSVDEVKLVRAGEGDRLRFRVFVTDRNFHHNQLFSLTGVIAEEMQARQMLNEIKELMANLSTTENRNVPMNVAAYHWLENFYHPTLIMLAPIIRKETDPSELYCQILEHKWYLSERAKEDVGHHAATEDYFAQIARDSVVTNG